MKIKKIFGISHWSLVMGQLAVAVAVGSFFPQLVFAGASVSISGGGWDIGTKAASSESTSTANQWTITNNASGGSETVQIKVVSDGGWTASIDDTPATDEFLLRKDNSSGQIIIGSNADLVTGLANNATYSFGLYFKAPPTNSTEGLHTLTVTLTATSWVHSCGLNIVGSDTYSYETVGANLAGPTTGDYKCWIAKNLGATIQASAVSDATPEAAGSYYQFGKATPGWASGWTYTTDWNIATDPCASVLGTGWRLPTNAEWTYADSASGGNWDTWSGPFASVLKLHAAGANFFGSLSEMSVSGYYWSATANGDYGYNLRFASGFCQVNGSQKTYAFVVRCLRDWVCGDSMTLDHKAAGLVAPIDKRVTYGTVSTAIAGTGTKCWITQNLGAANQATAATDATEPSAGWYWQFNRQQGYYQPNANGAYISTATPSTWNNTNDNTYTGWDPAKDPCTLLLGAGWRLPTYNEWLNANATGGWTGIGGGYVSPFASVLKLHAAGKLSNSIDGTMTNRGNFGHYWSSTQPNSINGYHLTFISNISSTEFTGKATGYSVRCLKD